MNSMTWNNSMSVNVESLDAQHKAIIALINELGDAMNAGKTDVVIGSILSKLIAYTQYHFDYEENCMIVSCFAHHDHHKCEHDGLKKKVKALEKDFLAGKANVADEIMNTLQQWLDHHIMKTDMLYSSHFTTIGLQ